jgi:hypothetical protein
MERLRTRELLVDIFGAFIPGFAFVLLAISMLGLASNLLYEVVSSLVENRNSIASWNETGKTLVTNSAAAFLGIVFVMVLSYLIGLFAMRCPVRRVDRISWWRTYGRGLSCVGISDEKLQTIMRSEAPENWINTALAAAHAHKSKKHIAEAAEKLEELYHAAARTHGECFFPYSNLKSSLASKRLTELEKMVPWSADDKSTLPFCCVDFVDLMKLRIRTYFPAAFVELAKQEASVRILSSAWYLARSLSWLALILGLVIVFLSAAKFYMFFNGVIKPANAQWAWALPVAALAIIVLGFCAARFAVKKSFKPREHDRPFVDEYNMYATHLLITTIVLVLVCVLSCLFIYSISYAVLVQILAEIALLGFHCTILVILVGLGGQSAQIRIEKEFHRLRRRELVNTLQVAWLTFRHQPELLRDLIPDWQPSETRLFKAPFENGKTAVQNTDAID